MVTVKAPAAIEIIHLTTREGRFAPGAFDVPAIVNAFGVGAACGIAGKQEE
jgi:hypothetical protein